jgi:hypothetical protein
MLERERERDRQTHRDKERKKERKKFGKTSTLRKERKGDSIELQC